MAAPTTKEKVAKALGFDAPKRDDDTPSISNADPFIEPEPTVREYIEALTPSLRDVGHYIYNLFPFIHWIGKYNLTWFFGDLIAGKQTSSVFPSAQPQGLLSCIC
jgi:sodium-independent sulfate anion transporter 11